jgi:D-arginine dehydrogenase
LISNSDFIVIGAGIAGASICSFLAPHGSVTLLEREQMPGYHSSGRSAAIFTVAIEALSMRQLALASRSFFLRPPEGFCDYPLVRPRGSMTVAWGDSENILTEELQLLETTDAHFARLDPAEATARCPYLRKADLSGAVIEKDAMDIDVDLLLQSYLRTARTSGLAQHNSVDIMSIERQGGLWHVRTRNADFVAPVVVNAAGAWADRIAALADVHPLGLKAYRRTAFTFSAPMDDNLNEVPYVRSAASNWYFKPDAGRFLGSLADAVEVAPHDVLPEDIDVAQGLFNLMEDTTFDIDRPIASWAGLRTFTTDRNPVAGFDRDAEGFFWLAGQGGCGVLTSPALGQAAAALARNRPLPDPLLAAGLTAAQLSPGRFA